MNEPFSFGYFGSIITAQSLGVSSIPPLDQTITAHCMPVTNDGKIVAVDIVGRGVDIPGGHIDDGETADAAMRRELYEETYVTVGEAALIDVWHLSSHDERIGLTERPYLLLYAAKVVSIENFVATDEVARRLLLTPDEFIEQYFGDKAQAGKMVDIAIAAVS